ncbi:MAG: TonB-dependent receptor [Bacteroidales bacterium]|jgi:outer membrane cobalamin receptor|nr:TonB-dependent receptor [Bacteroidales bacterium]
MTITRKAGLQACLYLVAGLYGNLLTAQETDTTAIFILDNVTVYNKRPLPVRTSATPLQLLDSLRLVQLPAMQLSDAVRYFAGVTVKDYGGIGGLKTVSVRSLGANHTLIAYDGLPVSDYQTGQVNIGRFSLDNMAAISLANGNENDIFLPARLFSSGSVLSFHTLQPVFRDKKTVNGRIAFRTGSFLLFNPSFLLENKIGKRISTSIYTEYIYHKGEYPFTIHNGDSISKEKRTNTDIQVFRLDANCFVHFSDKHYLSAKLFYYYDNQGLPGAVILYNTQSLQRMWEENIFAQIHYQYTVSQKVSYQSNGKINYGYLRYLDPDYLNIEGKLDNKYWQREYYLSNAVLYKPLQSVFLSLSNDLSLNNMNTSMSDFSNPTRYSSLTALSAMYKRQRMNVSATLLHTFVADKTETGKGEKEYNRLTPSVSLSVNPFAKEDMSVRFFYKNSFRLPTFNDLYYRLVGNTDLAPEITHQLNLGLAWLKYLHRHLPYFSFTADLYFNRVKDKIIAIPNKNLFVWTMINLGKVSIAGVDIQMETNIKASEAVAFDITFRYTFQHAVDVTDKQNKTYMHQIPYTPRHSGSGVFVLQTKWINFAYTVLCVGSRYMLGQNTAANYIEGYFEHNAALFRSFKLKNTQLSLRAEVLNILNKQYETVKSYPMTGRQFQGKVIFEF